MEIEHEEKELHHGIEVEKELKRLAGKQVRQLNESDGKLAPPDHVELIKVKTGVATQEIEILKQNRRIAVKRKEILQLMSEL